MQVCPTSVDVCKWHGVLLAGLHESEGVNVHHMYGQSDLCAHQQATVCEVWACANICLWKAAHLGLRQRVSLGGLDMRIYVRTWGMHPGRFMCVHLRLDPQAWVEVWVL